MNYCKKCIQPDTRPKIYFKDGICGACLWEEEKKTIDWDGRLKELREICDTTLPNNTPYDCVIGVSGGKDSTFQAIYARDTLGLRPLLVNCEPENITDCGRYNIENLKRLGFDVIMVRPNPRIMKILIKRDFFVHCNPMKCTDYALFASSCRVAHAFGIKLIIQGENAALTLGVSDGLNVDGDALNVDKGNTLSEDWRNYITDEVKEEDLYLFHYDKDTMRRQGYRAIWLQYYVKEWSQPHNARFSKQHGMRTKSDYGFVPENEGTYLDYFQVDSPLIPLNQFLKYIKLGFGQCTDHACYDIREGTMTRERGLELVKQYDGLCGNNYIEDFCKYIDITLDEFWAVVKRWEVK